MPARLSRIALSVALGCAALAAHAGNAAPVVRTEAELKAVLASGRPTPLDALTPYGKRRFLRQMQWSERGLGGFGFTSLVRELDPPQIAAVMAFFDSNGFSPARGRDFSGPPLRLPEPSRDMQGRFEQLERFEQEQSRRRSDDAAQATTLDASRLEGRYLALFAGQTDKAALSRLPASDLVVLFDAAALASWNGRGPVAFEQLMQVYGELQARGIDTRRTLDDTVLDQLLAAREFAQAKAFAAAKPHLKHHTIPAVHDPLGQGFAGRSVYRYDAAARSLTREALPRPSGFELVMVVDAGCGFSTMALEALQGDAELRARLLKANLTLVTPPRSSIAYRFVDEWNAANPALPMRIPYNVREWQAVDVAGVPQFFLLKDGKVVAQRTGWPREGNKAALRRMLDSAAL